LNANIFHPGTFGRRNKEEGKVKFYEYVLLMVLATVILPFAMVIMLFVLESDPLSFILPEFEDFFLLKFVLFLVRYFLFQLAFYGIWLPYGCLYLLLVIGIKVFSDVSSLLLKWTEVRLNNKSSGKRRNVTIGSIVMIHRQVRGVLDLINESCIYLIPSLLLFGQIILVLTNYATIKMHDSIPMPFYLVMPFLSVFVIAIIATLFPAASDVHEGSLEFLRSVHLIVGRSKYWRKVWRAEQPLRFNVGPFFIIKRSTKTTFFYQCIDFTVTALMLT
jgi:hypothetical protein